MNAIEIIESFFTEDQIEVIKATIRYGSWGYTDHIFRSGDQKIAYCFCTSDAKFGLKGKYTPKQISGYFSAIEKIIEANKFDFINHESDYWGNWEKDEGMLLFDGDLLKELYKWSEK